ADHESTLLQLPGAGSLSAFASRSDSPVVSIYEREPAVFPWFQCHDSVQAECHFLFGKLRYHPRFHQHALMDRERLERIQHRLRGFSAASETTLQFVFQIGAGTR